MAKVWTVRGSRRRFLAFLVCWDCRLRRLTDVVGMAEAKIAEGATVYGLGVVDGVVKLLGGGEAGGANFDEPRAWAKEDGRGTRECRRGGRRAV